MKFEARTEREIVEKNLIPHKTVCDFDVLQAQNTTSKSSGASMIALKLRVFYGGGFKLINAYLMAAMPAQLRHFCETGGLMTQYASETLDAEDCKPVTGKVKIKIEDKDDGYPPKNAVMDYVVPDHMKGGKAKPPTETPATPPAKPGADDDVPF